MAAVAFAAFITTHFLPYTRPVDLKISKIQIKNIQEFESRASRNDVASLNFDLEVDSTSMWNWNVKQLFLYLVAEYETDRNSLNQVVVWDKIVLRKQIDKAGHGKLKYKNQKNK